MADNDREALAEAIQLSVLGRNAMSMDTWRHAADAVLSRWRLVPVDRCPGGDAFSGYRHWWMDNEQKPSNTCLVCGQDRHQVGE